MAGRLTAEGLAASCRRVSADPLCSGLLRLPHVHLTIVTASPILRRRVTTIPAGVSLVVGSRRRSMLGSRREGAHVCRGWPSTAAKSALTAEGVPSSLRIAECRCMVGRELSESRRAWARPRRRGSGDNGPNRQLRSKDAPAGAARVRARRRSQAGTAGAGLRRLAARGACLSLWLSLNRVINQCVTSCHVARTVVEVRYLFRRRARCVWN
jgi:hypothetical protein